MLLRKRIRCALFSDWRPQTRRCNKGLCRSLNFLRSMHHSVVYRPCCAAEVFPGSRGILRLILFEALGRAADRAGEPLNKSRWIALRAKPCRIQGARRRSYSLYEAEERNTVAGRFGSNPKGQGFMGSLLCRSTCKGSCHLLRLASCSPSHEATVATRGICSEVPYYAPPGWLDKTKGFRRSGAEGRLL